MGFFLATCTIYVKTYEDVLILLKQKIVIDIQKIL